MSETYREDSANAEQRTLAQHIKDHAPLSIFDDVAAFHDKFGLDVPDTPEMPSREMHLFRFKFLEEELRELAEAYWHNDLPKYADALIDLIYVAAGTLDIIGVEGKEAWDIVHGANMAKRRATSASESTRGSTLDVVKPEGWQPPDMAQLLIDQGWVPPEVGPDDLVKNNPHLTDAAKEQLLDQLYEAGQ